MGTFTVGCLIKNHVDREKAVKIPRLMVDFIGSVIQGQGGPPPVVEAEAGEKIRRRN